MLVTEAHKGDDVVQDIMAAKARGVRRLPRYIMDKGIRLAMGDLAVRDNRLWINETRLFTPEDHRLYGAWMIITGTTVPDTGSKACIAS
jgi:hypothetical protein